MDWSFGLAMAGFGFMVIGTLIIIISLMVKGRDPNQGWAFIVLGIALIVVFGTGLEKIGSALGIVH